MKNLKLFLPILLAVILMTSLEAYAKTQEEIRIKNETFKTMVEIDIEEYDDARINNVYLEHRQRVRKTGAKDYLYVKGSLKNLRKTILAGAYVTAKFYDSDGKLIDVERGEVIPRIMRQYRKNRGKFTVRLPYNSQISLCKLTATWSGKEDEETQQY